METYTVSNVNTTPPPWTPAPEGAHPAPAPGGSAPAPEMIILVVYLVLCSVAGVIGNGLVLIVYWPVHRFHSRRSLRSGVPAAKMHTASLYILTLAVVDFITCLVVIPFTTYLEYKEFELSSDFLCKFYNFLITFNIPFSTLAMVLIAVDRYLSLILPLCHMRLVTKRVAFLQLGAIFSISMMFGVTLSLIRAVEKVPPTIHTGNITWTNMTNSNTTSYDVTGGHVKQVKSKYICSFSTEILSEATIDRVVDGYLYLFVISFLVMAIIYTFLFSKLYRAGSRCLCVTKKAPRISEDYGRNGNHRSSAEFQRNVRLAVMLFAVALTFVITYGPTIVISLQWAPYQINVFYLYFLNHVLNPAIYAFVSKEFRGKLRAVVCKPKETCNSRKSTTETVSL